MPKSPPETKAGPKPPESDAGASKDPTEASGQGRSPEEKGRVAPRSAAPFFARITRAIEKRWVQFFVLLPLLSFIALGLNYGTRGTCFPFIIVPLVVLVIPYYFGLKKVKNLLVLGLLTLLLSGMMWGVVDSHCLRERTCGYDWNTVASREDLGTPQEERFIEVGTVDPLSGGEGDYNFSAVINVSKVRELGRSVSSVRAIVWDYGTIIWGNDNPVYNVTLSTPDGGANATLMTYWSVARIDQRAVFVTEFFITTSATRDNRTSHFTDRTYTLVGPITASITDAYADFVPNRTVISVGIYGIMLLFMLSILWWSRRAKEKRAEMEQQLRDLEAKDKAKGEGPRKEAEFACTACGAGVSDDDTKCPSCGAVFEEEPGGGGPGEPKDIEKPAAAARPSAPATQPAPPEDKPEG